MRNLLIKKRYDFLFLCLLAFFPLYKYSITSLITISFLLISFTISYKYYRNEFVDFLTLKKQYFFITVSFYFLLIISLSYSANIAFGIRNIEHGLYLLVFPLAIIFFVPSLSKNQIKYVWLSFIVACNLYLLYLHYCFFQSGIYFNYRETRLNDLPFRDVVMNLEWGSGHPTYVSMWFLFSAIFLIHFIWQERMSLMMKFFLIVDVGALISSAILLSSKITTIAFVISMVVLVCMMIKNKLVLLSSIVVIIVLFVLSVFNISFLRARFIEEFQITEMKPPVGIQTNSLNIRVGIFQCSQEVFIKNWLVGTGIGDVQDELDQCYQKFDTDVYNQDVYNAHNNFFDIALSTGILGLMSFVIMLAFHIRESVRYKNTLFLVFIVFIVICMLPENILSRNSGVIFYAFFSSLMIKQNLQQRIAYDSLKK